MDTTDLQRYITKKALNNGALLVGYTKIRRTEPVIIMGFEYSDKWFFNFPITLTKKLGEVYFISKNVQDMIAKELKREGYITNYKTILSIYGDFRPLVVSAGLGEWGRNGLVVNKKYGSGLLYAAIFTNAPFKTENTLILQTSEKHCTECEECIKSCPANAFENNTFHLYRCMPYALKGCAQCLKVCKGNNC
ncbi:4Fe-4S ferredoxin [Thermohalobacter berrensis]|uniref:4Fe-4S ferredoxin n=1 Tax=Thermohalobacter berrensis TaxID=99594 RepID=A0A419T0Y6_9FIRM|nr:4Fe-4S ferredoxin [Thermohalobacter berrensis]RKD31240.1 4Fe-4S ferredoxin [Thermohalobacter berrensis]